MAVRKSTEIRTKAAEPKVNINKSAPRFRSGEVLVLLKSDTNDFQVNKQNKSFSKVNKSPVSIDDLSGKSDQASKTILALKKYHTESIEKVFSGGNEKQIISEKLPRWVKVKFSESGLKNKFKSDPDIKGANQAPSSNDLVRYVVNNITKDSTLFEKVEPNYLRSISETIPNDSRFMDQWGLKNHTNPGNDISAPNAWDTTTGSESVVIGVVDSGIKQNHEDLTPDILWTNSDEIDGNNIDDDQNGFVDDIHGVNLTDSPNNDDEIGHGSHVSGIIAAKSNNSLGVSGICWRCKIMAVKIFGSEGSADDATCANGVVYAVNNGSTVINASWGGPYASSIISDSVQYAISHNVTFIAAAGNDNRSAEKDYPGSIPGVITVSAFDTYGAKADFSNYGSAVEVAAPGVSILSTVQTDTHAYAYYSGTSMAAPFVTGIVALMQSRGISNYSDIYKRLIVSASQGTPTHEWSDQFGFGKINASLALSDPAQTEVCAITNVNPSTVAMNTLPIRGHAFTTGQFSRYKLEVGEGVNPSSWSTLGVTLTNGGTREILEGELGSLNTQNYTTNIWSVRLSVYPSQGLPKTCQTSFTNALFKHIYVDSHNTAVQDGTTLHPYRTIQQAIDSTEGNAHIHVKSGTYNENPHIYQNNIILEGEPGSLLVSTCTNPFVCNTNALSISTLDLSVPVEHVTVKNMSIIANGHSGIVVSGYADNIFIENNTIIQSMVKPCPEATCDDYGIKFDFFITDSEINYNSIHSFTNAIMLNGESVQNNNIKHNYGTKSLFAGLNIHSLGGISFNNISENTFINSQVSGIITYTAETNKYFDNVLIKSISEGIADMWTYNSSVYNNSFLMNGRGPLYLQNSSGITFTNPVSNTGNYYDSFHLDTQAAPDKNIDGIIDAPYVIDSGTQDSAPYKYPHASKEALPSIIYTPYIVNIDQPVVIQSTRTSISFGNSNSSNRVWLNKGTPHEYSAPITSWNNQAIIINIPDSVHPGRQNVTVQKADGSLLDAGYFVLVMREDLAVSVQSMDLQTGWNWVTLKNMPVNTDVRAVLGNIVGKYDKVLSENGIYATWLPENINTLRDLVAGPMYMIHMTVPGTLKVYGTPILPNQPISLHTGWNWIGYFGDSAVSIESALVPIANTYQKVLSQDLYYDPSNPGISSLTALEPNKGYMLYSDKDQSFSYPGETVPVDPVSLSSQCSSVITNQYTNIYADISSLNLNPKSTYMATLFTPSGTVAGCGSIINNILTISRVFGRETINSVDYPGYSEGENIGVEIFDMTTKKSVGTYSTNQFFTGDNTVHPIQLTPGNKVTRVTTTCTNNPDGTSCKSCPSCATGTVCKTKAPCFIGTCIAGKCKK